MLSLSHLDRDIYLLMLGRCKIDIVGIQKKKGRKERRRKEGRGEREIMGGKEEAKSLNIDYNFSISQNFIKKDFLIPFCFH